MHIVVGSIQQETNTFNPELTGLNDFLIAEGEAMLSRIAVSDYLKAEGCTIHPTLYANAVPAGRLAADAFRSLLSRMLELFPAGDPIDGVWLYCHGALEVDQIGSGDVAILEAVRRRVGPSVPIAVAMDFHANLDPRIAGLANVLCGYRTAPHTDMAETQLRAARALLAGIRSRELPQVAFVRVPLLLTGDKVITAAEPMRSIIRAAEQFSLEPGVLDASVFNGQPWVDAEQAGASAVVVARSRQDLDRAGVIAGKLADRLWQARAGYFFQAAAADADEVIDQALREPEGPIFISDSGDNTTAGAPGNRTDLLRSLLSRPLRRVLLAGLTDKAAVACCRNLIPGQIPEEQLESPTLLLLRQNGLKPVFRTMSRMLGWDGEDAGPAAVLSVPDLDLIITERRCAFISPEIIESAGVSLRDYQVIIVKLGYLYPKLAAIARKAYLALTPGASCETIEQIPYTRIRRPIYPLDQDFDWQASGGSR